MINHIHTKIKKWIEAFDAWVLRVVHHHYLKSTLFILAFLEAIISPILPEAILIAILAYRKDISWKLLTFVSALGSTFGAIVLYWFGRLFYESYGAALVSYLHMEEIMISIGNTFADNTFVTMFLAAFTPLPDRVFSFAAGVYSISFVASIGAIFLARLIRAGIAAKLSYEYGDEARALILKNTKLFTIAIFLLVALYAVYKYTV